MERIESPTYPSTQPTTSTSFAEPPKSGLAKSSPKMAAPGETDLNTLLSTLTVSLSPETYLFLTFPPPTTIRDLPSTLPLKMAFQEHEGLTVITTEDAARDHGYTQPDQSSTPSVTAAFPCRMITLNVHSSLEAVGFIAVIATELKKIGMGVNPVSGFFHDHCFVPVGREEEAVSCLEKLAERAKKGEAV
jgi:hypothetical protein